VSLGLESSFGTPQVASMLFALLVLKSAVGDRRVIFDVASIAIVASIAAHGLTDTIGTAWVGERVRRRDP
jgi:hypothetical protein